MMYGRAAAMGISPLDLDQMFAWQIFAAFEGWAEANGVKPRASEGMSDERAAELGIIGF